MTEDESRDLEHAWRYFALHAEQRMTVFNFFVASAGLALTGLAWTLADGSGKWPLGAAAGLGAAALSLVFWRLDQRGGQLVKNAEDAMVALESGLPRAAAVTTAERRLPNNASWTTMTTPWTFGRSFRLLFAAVAILGIVGAAITIRVGTSKPKPAHEEQGPVVKASRGLPASKAAAKPVTALSTRDLPREGVEGSSQQATPSATPSVSQSRQHGGTSLRTQ
ncbi:hypothetical protein [Sphingomonas sp. ACRSK]|uniref:hypothetical protein n=1 Tax=Sphingomonas sp. ACRSK TaxID=2918213 RepID=UPI001EF4D0EB|nr:hypothetical protein [Sphingomonas sp. ACRSK]MCG7349598.1 hypothetical protein [Sphingomonas sp. ACRSK]